MGGIVLDKNVEMLNDTLKIFKCGQYVHNGSIVHCRITPQQRAQARAYLPEEVAQVIAIQPPKGVPYHHVSCRNADSFSVARDFAALHKAHGGRLRRTLVLNLANPVNPGGSVYHGGKAQEEDLCRKSSLLFSLTSEGAAPFYECNRKNNSPTATNALILSPRVEIIKDEHGMLLQEPEIVSVLSCAAPMVRYGLGGLTTAQYEALLYSRILGILKCAAFWGYENLVLGAFGCGVFGNDAALVAPFFRKALEECCGNYHNVVFAVLDKTPNLYNFSQFYRVFGNGCMD